MKFRAAVVLSLICCLNCLAAELPLVPWPTSVHVNPDGRPMVLSSGNRIIAASSKEEPLAKILSDEIFLITGQRLQQGTGQEKNGDIVLKISNEFVGDEYKLMTGGVAIVIGADYNAVAMGTATLLQAIQKNGTSYVLPELTVDDKPAFKYRGAMLDVARKPHSVATLKAVVEAMRLLKIRQLMLHMSDENAWTFPSTKYPQLASQSAVWPTGEKMPGYTVAELKDLVAFADARGVTVIPELELYGHSGQMRATMPEVFCFLDDKGQRVGGPVINTASDQAYTVIDTLIGEAADIFKSSPYINVGCDEASPAGTENFSEVKALVEREKLPYPHAIFNYHVRKLNEIVKKYGKQTIVWEGARMDPTPLPKDIIFLPWVGNSGFAATLDKEGYPFINAPWGSKKTYMDVYECNGAQIPPTSQNLIGATALSWQAPEEAALPFMRWQGPLRIEPTHNPNSGKDLDDFIRRDAVTDQMLDLAIHGFTFDCKGLLEPTVFKRIDPMFSEKATLALRTNLAGKVHYTLDGSEPTEKSPVYGEPIVLSKTTQVRAKLFGPDSSKTLYEFNRKFYHTPSIASAAQGAKVTITPDNPGYYGPGPAGMTDGILAAGDNFSDPGWVGWNQAPVQIDIDMGKPKSIRDVIVHNLRGDGGLDYADEMKFSVSDDGTAYRPIGSVNKEQGLANRGWFKLDLSTPVSSRYLRINTTPGKEWIFIDEVVVNGEIPGPNFKSASTGKPITFAAPPKGYVSNRPDALTDGYVTSGVCCHQIEFQGWEATNLDATIDLGKPTELKVVGGHFLKQVFMGVHPPGWLKVSVSNDGKDFREVAEIKLPPDKTSDNLYTYETKLSGARARYVKFVAPTNGLWLFCDELYVNPEKP